MEFGFFHFQIMHPPSTQTITTYTSTLNPPKTHGYVPRKNPPEDPKP